VTLPHPAGLRPSELRPVAVHHSLRAQVADAVRAALVAGSMTSGEVYSAPQLAERFGVSVTPVREALLELVRDGLLVAVRNRGFRVADPTEVELDATSEVRLLLEPAAAARAAGQPAERRAAAEQRLRAAARAVIDAAEAGDVVAHVRSDREFHAALLDLAGNAVLSETVLRLRDRSRLYGRDSDIAQDTLRQAAVEHDRLVDLVLAGDADGARELMAGHVAHVRAEWSPGGPAGHERRPPSRPEGPTSARSAAARPDAHPSTSPTADVRE
jgi:DNA-binding GntR family transcriptional regulator